MRPKSAREPELSPIHAGRRAAEWLSAPSRSPLAVLSRAPCGFDVSLAEAELVEHVRGVCAQLWRRAGDPAGSPGEPGRHAREPHRTVRGFHSLEQTDGVEMR